MERVETTEAEPDTVIDQDPEAGALVAGGSTVTATVADEVEPVAVPDLVDLPEDDALAALDDAGLEPGARSEAFSDTVAARATS